MSSNIDLRLFAMFVIIVFSLAIYYVSYYLESSLFTLKEGS